VLDEPATVAQESVVPRDDDQSHHSGDLGGRGDGGVPVTRRSGRRGPDT
jgi:hypothetical protein